MGIEPITIDLGDVTFDLTRKNIRSLRLSIRPPQGRVMVSAPLFISMDEVRRFVGARLDWIKAHQQKIRNCEWEPPKQFVTGEKHCYQGQVFLLRVLEGKNRGHVDLQDGVLEMRVLRNASRRRRQALLEAWYRSDLKVVVPQIITQYEAVMQVKVRAFGIKKMTTRWGTCNRTSARIWINLELAKRSRGCLEFIVVHEMVHLLERLHNQRFRTLMDQFLPDWRSYQKELKDKHLPNSVK